MNTAPFVRELNPAPSVAEVLRSLADWPDLCVLESSLVREPLGRYSWVTADPIDRHCVETAVLGQDPFTLPREWIEQLRVPAVPGLPPFQAGIIGLLSYELGGCFEQLPEWPRERFAMPVALLNLYDWTLAWDHQQQRCWFIGQTVPRGGHLGFQPLPSHFRWQHVQAALQRGPAPLPNVSLQQRSAITGTPLRDHEHVLSNFSRSEYLDAVARVVEYIHAGDIFQANLSQRLSTRATGHPLQTYLKLRETNPAPFSGYFAYQHWAVLSSSPERFLRLDDSNSLSTRPIKGTRRRRQTPEADLFTRDELRESAKDQAENVMIVDLLRNDLSRVCQPGSVRVPQLCTVEAYETVSHLVSEVRGELRPDCDFWDALAAAFPGGSITGAPKIRAMEIIAELERVPRRAYCGSLLYHSLTGAADSNILIRTLTQQHGWLHFPAGGGIVADSLPQAEYEETLHKAAGMLRAVNATLPDSE